ncbi:MAG: hypothetical protein H0U76_22755 [Ktedonobacteraceae bacterium]|nr:hypothetical protein [Ktedonobacteraceae bacterium]
MFDTHIDWVAIGFDSRNEGTALLLNNLISSDPDARENSRQELGLKIFAEDKASKGTAVLLRYAIDVLQDILSPPPKAALILFLAESLRSIRYYLVDHPQDEEALAALNLFRARYEIFRELLIDSTPEIRMQAISLMLELSFTMPEIRFFLVQRFIELSEHDSDSRVQVAAITSTASMGNALPNFDVYAWLRTLFNREGSDFIRYVIAWSWLKFIDADLPHEILQLLNDIKSNLVILGDWEYADEVKFNGQHSYSFLEYYSPEVLQPLNTASLDG